MRKNVGVCFVLMVMIVFAGCEESSTLFKVLPEKKAQQVIKINPSNAENDAGISKYENMGVAIDTVVDVFREPDTRSDRTTQVTYNQPLILLEERDSWMKVNLMEGPAGWIKAKYVDRNCNSIIEDNYKNKVVITAKTKDIRWGSSNNVVIKDVVMGTEFYVLAKREGGYEIALPQDQIGWVDVSGTILLDAGSKIPKTSPLDFLTTADKLRGSTYEVGGISCWGMDGSGLVYICGRINGIVLPREVERQFEMGSQIQTEAAKPGDLLFFSSSEDLKEIDHVGIVLEEEKFIHANKSKGIVMVSSLNENYYQRRLVGIKRIFD